ncbi:MAG: carboxypeptidase regulatory-like domain-containing protein [Acidobacteria bacterium]|nr:carboxypeptidase regulatory-like domain-containing protein [Acidobacteriota bacterium]
MQAAGTLLELSRSRNRSSYAADGGSCRTGFQYLLSALGFCCLAAHLCTAQVSASLSGVITDSSGAAVSAATVNARSLESGTSRSGVTDQSGRYQFFALPVGVYEIRATKEGFAEGIRSGVRLVVGQDASVDLSLRIGEVTEKVKVTADAAVVNLTTQDISGLVGERQVKDLPLNGRSYDLLLTLNPGIVNFTWEKTGGIGVSNSTTGNDFAVAGNRPQQNLFILNGVEFTGAAENNMQPGGSSGQLLGVDAVKEFNVLRDSYGPEYGKHPGGQVNIVTQSGTNELHGSIYEFLRNSALDASNYFDKGSAPPFQRNQFGAALGGPLRGNKTFLFGNYEGLRQHLHQTSLAFVPDDGSRAGAVPAVQPLLNLWPQSATEACNPSCGIAEYFSSPLQTVREDFGTLRLDHNLSSRDSLSSVFTIDDGDDFTETVLDPYSSDILTLREQVFSLEETHSFSAATVNVARVGYSRAGYFFTGEPTPGTPAAAVPGFLAGHQVGAVVVGGSAASNPQAAIGLAGSNNGSNLRIARNMFSFEDRVSMTRRRHQLTFGAWFQPFQSNETIALSQYAQATFSSLTNFLQGNMTSFLWDPVPTEMNWRSLFGAWYGQDVIRVVPHLTVSLGFRNEFTTGWNEAHGRAANYTFNNGVISNTSHVGNSLFIVNNAKFLPQPRVGLAFSPFTDKTVIRAGFGMYNDLQDALGYRADQNAPFNRTYSVGSATTPFPVSSLPIDASAAPPKGAKLVPGGVQPDMNTPTLISWSLRVQQEITRDTSVTLGYVGSHGYHELIGLDANEPFPVICPASPCPATYPSTFPAALAGAPVPAGTYYVPTNVRANPAIANTWTWFSLGTSNYHALQVDTNRRFSRGFSLRGVYTWAKALDDGDSLNATAAANAPGLVSNPFNPHADYGLATYDVRHVGVVNAVYTLPFGKGQPFANDFENWRAAIVSGWSVNSIVTVQSGFPFTPQLSYNPSNNGDTRNPVRPFINPDFSGPIILGRPSQWFNPNAFLAPPPNSGFYGNLGRNTLIGPGLATWDFSAFKATTLHERLALQFRAEIFNLLNRANFNTPNLITFTASGSTTKTSGTAGAISGTSTTSRQIQFGLKLIW